MHLELLEYLAEWFLLEVPPEVIVKVSAGATSLPEGLTEGGGGSPSVNVTFIIAKVLADVSRAVAWTSHHGDVSTHPV